jgi:hypothetical protein
MQSIPLPPLNTRCPNKPFSRRTRTRTRDVPTATCATLSALPPTFLIERLGSSSLSLLTVERALAELEVNSTGATLGLGRHAGAPTLPILGSATSRMHYEVPQNFVQGLLSPKDRVVVPGTRSLVLVLRQQLLRLRVGSRWRWGRGRRVESLRAVRVGVGVRRRVLMALRRRRLLQDGSPSLTSE